MPDELDDYDIDRARAEEEELGAYGEPLPPYGEPPRRRPRIDFPVILAIVGVLAIAIMAVLFLVFRKPAQPAPTPVAVSTPPLVLATPTPSVPVPPLEESDVPTNSLATTFESSLSKSAMRSLAQFVWMSPVRTTGFEIWLSWICFKIRRRFIS